MSSRVTPHHQSAARATERGGSLSPMLRRRLLNRDKGLFSSDKKVPGSFFNGDQRRPAQPHKMGRTPAMGTLHFIRRRRDHPREASRSSLECAAQDLFDWLLAWSAPPAPRQLLSPTWGGRLIQRGLWWAACGGRPVLGGLCWADCAGRIVMDGVACLCATRAHALGQRRLGARLTTPALAYAAPTRLSSATVSFVGRPILPVP